MDGIVSFDRFKIELKQKFCKHKPHVSLIRDSCSQTVLCFV